MVRITLNTIRGGEIHVPRVDSLFGSAVNGESVFDGKFFQDVYKRQLSAYLLGGITSDHECDGEDEALEKLRRGMYLICLLYTSRCV